MGFSAKYIIKNPLTKSASHFFTTIWQHWLGVAKPKMSKFLWNFKNFSFNYTSKYELAIVLLCVLVLFIDNARYWFHATWLPTGFVFFCLPVYYLNKHIKLCQKSVRLFLTHCQGEICQISLGPTGCRATATMAEDIYCNNKNDDLLQINEMTTLYLWLLL